MFWRDLFYFSKGERTGLIVLLSIIVIAVTILYLTHKHDSATDKTRINEMSNLPNATETAAMKDTLSVHIGEAAEEKTPLTPRTEQQQSSPPNTRETVSERVNRLTSNARPTYERVEKFEEGVVVELNTADTTTLKKIPGIGSAFANRIVNYRTILGGYHSVMQLSEVYGIDEERFQAFLPWFSADPSLIKKVQINTIPQDSLQRHPYISYAQARVIMQIRRQKGKLTGWENLQLLNEFTESDKKKLQPYLSFD